MGMSIQEILAAQQRAASATRKYKPAPFRNSGSGAKKTVAELLKAQQTSAKATRKPVAVQPIPPAAKSNIAELIEQQRITAAAQKPATSGVSHAISASQKATVDAIKEAYKKFIAKLDKELAGQEWFAGNGAADKPVDKPQEPEHQEPIFTPNVPDTMEVVIEPQNERSAVNGISVGEEMGGQVAVSARPKRKRRTKAVKQETVGDAQSPVNCDTEA